MTRCDGKRIWPNGPKCQGEVQTVLVDTTTGRMMSREVESVPLCQAHIAYADQHGQLVIDFSNVS
jgi:hypothetical protein